MKETDEYKKIHNGTDESVTVHPHHYRWYNTEEFWVLREIAKLLRVTSYSGENLGKVKVVDG